MSIVPSSTRAEGTEDDDPGVKPREQKRKNDTENRTRDKQIPPHTFTTQAAFIQTMGVQRKVSESEYENRNKFGVASILVSVAVSA